MTEVLCNISKEVQIHKITCVHLHEYPAFRKGWRYFKGQLTSPETKGQHHGMDWGGHVHPTLLEPVFIPLQKRYKNRQVCHLATNSIFSPSHFFRAAAAPAETRKVMGHSQLMGQFKIFCPRSKFLNNSKKFLKSF